MIPRREQDPDRQEELRYTGTRSNGPLGRQSWLMPILSALGVTAIVIVVAMAAHARDRHEKKGNVALPLPAYRSTSPTAAQTPTTSTPTPSQRPKPQPTQPEPSSTKRQITAFPSTPAVGTIATHTNSATQPGPSGSTPSPRVTATAKAPPPTTYPEEAYNKHGVPTFADYANASDLGPDIQFTQVVQVSCKIYDPSIPSASPDGYWYRIASSPWDNRYYAVANTFLNGLSPTDPNTNYYDPRVPDCK
jgi:hypothetical protein